MTGNHNIYYDYYIYYDYIYIYIFYIYIYFIYIYIYIYIKQCHQIIWIGEKSAERKNPKIAKVNKGKLTLLLKCAICDSRISKSIKKGPAGLLITLGLKASLTKIPLLGDILF